MLDSSDALCGAGLLTIYHRPVDFVRRGDVPKTTAPREPRGDHMNARTSETALLTPDLLDRMRPDTGDPRAAATAEKPPAEFTRMDIGPLLRALRPIRTPRDYEGLGELEAVARPPRPLRFPPAPPMGVR